MANILLEPSNRSHIESTDAGMTVLQAAEHLGVSTAYLRNLIDNAILPSHGVGPNRRILESDLKSYKRDIDEKRLAALSELVAQAQELGMGY